MNVRVRLFASLREAVGVSEVVVEVPEGTVAGLLARLGENHPPLRLHLAYVRVAVNRAIADLATTVRDGDEVALIPPVGGG